MAQTDGKTELNRAHFDNEAENYDAKHERAALEIVRRVQAKRNVIGLDWIEDEDEDEESEAEAEAESEADSDHDGAADQEEQQRQQQRSANSSKQPSRSVRVLDYACGTGAMSRAFAPYTTQCMGIDLSEKMVQVYNARARNQGLSEDEMSAYHGNLCVPEDPDPVAFRDPARFFGFDMAIVGLGFHHFDDPQLAASRLVARLRPGGVLVIIDFLPHEPVPAGTPKDENSVHSQPTRHHHQHHHHHHHGAPAQGHEKYGHGHGPGHAAHTVTHHGFSEEHITRIFALAGAGKDFAIDKLGQVTMGTHVGKRALFMARGTKA